MKIVVALLFLAILASLGSALFFMMRRDADTDNPNEDADARRGQRMARALALRVALSIGLLACLLLAWKLGYIHPSGLPITKQ